MKPEFNNDSHVLMSCGGITSSGEVCKNISIYFSIYLSASSCYLNLKSLFPKKLYEDMVSTQQRD